MKNNAERLEGLTVFEPTEQDLNKWFAERQAKWELEEKTAIAAMRTHAARCVLRPKSALHAKVAQEYLQGKRDSLPWWVSHD